MNKVYTAQELSILPIGELREISKKMGVIPHHASKEPKIIDGIITKQAENRPIRDPNLQEPVPMPEKKVAPVCTPEEVVEAIASFRPDSMKVAFKDGSFHFENKGRVDSGTLSQPLTHIVKLARLVARGGRAPATVKVNGDTVLAV